MKPVALVCLALGVLPTAAQSKSRPEIVAVAHSPEVQKWVDAVSRQIDDTLRYPYTFREPTPSGGVSLTFRRSDSGAPDTIQIIRTSGNKMLDSAAMSAIRRIKALDALPGSMAYDQVFQANIVFATDARTLARETQALRISSAQLIAKSPPNVLRPIQMAIAVSRE